MGPRRVLILSPSAARFAACGVARLQPRRSGPAGSHVLVPAAHFKHESPRPSPQDIRTRVAGRAIGRPCRASRLVAASARPHQADATVVQADRVVGALAGSGNPELATAMTSPTAAKSRQVPSASGPHLIALEGGQCRPIQTIQENQIRLEQVQEIRKRHCIRSFDGVAFTLSLLIESGPFFIRVAVPRHHRQHSVGRLTEGAL